LFVYLGIAQGDVEVLSEIVVKIGHRFGSLFRFGQQGSPLRNLVNRFKSTWVEPVIFLKIPQSRMNVRFLGLYSIQNLVRGVSQRLLSRFEHRFVGSGLRPSLGRCGGGGGVFWCLS